MNAALKSIDFKILWQHFYEYNISLYSSFSMGYEPVNTTQRNLLKDIQNELIFQVLRNVLNTIIVLLIQINF